MGSCESQTLGEVMGDLESRIAEVRGPTGWVLRRRLRKLRRNLDRHRYRALVEAGMIHTGPDDA